VVIKIADVLEVSVDYLVGKTFQEVDSATLKRIEEVAALPQEDKKQIWLVVALIREFRTRQTYYNQ